MKKTLVAFFTLVFSFTITLFCGGDAYAVGDLNKIVLLDGTQFDNGGYSCITQDPVIKSIIIFDNCGRLEGGFYVKSYTTIKVIGENSIYGYIESVNGDLSFDGDGELDFHYYGYVEGEPIVSHAVGVLNGNLRLGNGSNLDFNFKNSKYKSLFVVSKEAMISNNNHMHITVDGVNNDSTPEDESFEYDETVAGTNNAIFFIHYMHNLYIDDGLQVDLNGFYTLFQSDYTASSSFNVYDSIINMNNADAFIRANNLDINFYDANSIRLDRTEYFIDYIGENAHCDALLSGTNIVAGITKNFYSCHSEMTSGTPLTMNEKIRMGDGINNEITIYLQADNAIAFNISGRASIDNRYSDIKIYSNYDNVAAFYVADNANYAAYHDKGSVYIDFRGDRSRVAAIEGSAQFGMGNDTFFVNNTDYGFEVGNYYFVSNRPRVQISDDFAIRARTYAFAEVSDYEVPGNEHPEHVIGNALELPEWMLLETATFNRDNNGFLRDNSALFESRDLDDAQYFTVSVLYDNDLADDPEAPVTLTIPEWEEGFTDESFDDDVFGDGDGEVGGDDDDGDDDGGDDDGDEDAGDGFVTLVEYMYGNVTFLESDEELIEKYSCMTWDYDEHILTMNNCNVTGKFLSLNGRIRIVLVGENHIRGSMDFVNSDVSFEAAPGGSISFEFYDFGYSDDEYYYENDSYVSHAVGVSGGNLTINSGVFNFEDARYTPAMFVVDSDLFTINGGEFYINGIDDEDVIYYDGFMEYGAEGYVSDFNLFYTIGRMTINDGVFIIDSKSSYVGCVITAETDEAEITINGGYFEINDADAMFTIGSGSIYFVDGEFHVSGEGSDFLYSGNEGTFIEFYGGDFYVSTNYDFLCLPYEESTANFYGGKFYIEGNENADYFVGIIAQGQSIEINIYDGEFYFDYSQDHSKGFDIGYGAVLNIYDGLFRLNFGGKDSYGFYVYNFGSEVNISGGDFEIEIDDTVFSSAFFAFSDGVISIDGGDIDIKRAAYGLLIEKYIDSDYESVSKINLATPVTFGEGHSLIGIITNGNDGRGAVYIDQSVMAEDSYEFVDSGRHDTDDDLIWYDLGYGDDNGFALYEFRNVDNGDDDDGDDDDGDEGDEDGDDDKKDGDDNEEDGDDDKKDGDEGDGENNRGDEGNKNDGKNDGDDVNYDGIWWNFYGGNDNNDGEPENDGVEAEVISTEEEDEIEVPNTDNTETPVETKKESKNAPSFWWLWLILLVIVLCWIMRKVMRRKERR